MPRERDRAFDTDSEELEEEEDDEDGDLPGEPALVMSLGS